MVFAKIIERLNEALYEDTFEESYRALATQATTLRGTASTASVRAKETRSKAHHTAAGKAHMNAHNAAIAVATHAYNNNQSGKAKEWEGHADGHKLKANDHHTQAG